MSERASPVTGINLMRSHQWLAFARWAIGEPAKARDRFDAIGKSWNELPWQCLRFGLEGLLGSSKKSRRASRR